MMSALAKRLIGESQVLWHLTWDCYVSSIQRKGLIPDFKPSTWTLADARERSKGKIFLCTTARKSYWMMTYQDGWAKPPVKGAKPVWIKVDVSGLKLQKDEAPGESYEGDFWTNQSIPADRISL